MKESYHTQKKKVTWNLWRSHEPSILGRNWMRYTTHIKESCHTYKGVMSSSKYMMWNMRRSHEPNSGETEWCTSHISRSHVTRMKESYRTKKKSHVKHMNESRTKLGQNCMRHVTHFMEFRHTYKGVMSYWKKTCETCVGVTNQTSSGETEWDISHVWRSNVTRMKESYCIKKKLCPTYEWVTNQTRTKLNEARHTCQGVASQI